MDTRDLQKLGLNNNESIVYLALLSLGKSSAGQLARKTLLHRSVVYENLERLIDKGLIVFITQDKRRVFETAPAIMLRKILIEQREALDSKIELAKTFEAQVDRLQISRKTRSDAQILRGKRGIQLLFDMVLESKKSYCSFGAPSATLNLMGESFWKNLNVKTQECKMKVQLIFNESLRAYGHSISKEVSNLQIRYLEHGFDALTQTIVFGQYVAIIVWTEQPIVTLIKDQDVVKSYASYFKLLWKISHA